jgi:hypothetical protein
MAGEKKERKPIKLPKSLGACADLLHDTREDRLGRNRVVEELKKDEAQISEHIINQLDKNDEGGAVGKRYKALIKTDDTYIVEDWEAFYAHIKKTGEFDLLNRALNQAAVKERVAMQDRPSGKRGENWKPKLPPGVGRFTVKKISLTKV